MILREEVKDPRVDLATVSRVEVSRDLGHARVWISALGKESERLDAVEALRNATGFVRQMLAPRMRLRVVPQLRFELDRGAEHSQRISDLLKQQSYSEDDQDPDTR